ncbi:hypothetical protein OL229_04415 [Neisseriaceae bacterium JH1-16]|nr:hypothetical protein [Neisseriaceae bacterium JH1-16]
MLELTEARPDGHREIMVHARLNGVPVHFHIVDEAIDDFLRVDQAGVEGSASALKKHWDQFASRIEGFVVRHGAHDFLLTSAMLNP